MTLSPELPPILIAEDESDDLFLIEHRLQKAGIGNPVMRFRDGDELIAFLDAKSNLQLRPCLLLLDLKMPMVDGFDVLAWVRKHPRLAPMPVVVMSSSPTSRDGQRARAAGADEYHEKFPSAEELGAIVSRASAHPFARS